MATYNRTVTGGGTVGHPSNAAVPSENSSAFINLHFPNCSNCSLNDNWLK